MKYLVKVTRATNEMGQKKFEHIEVEENTWLEAIKSAVKVLFFKDNKKEVSENNQPKFFSDGGYVIYVLFEGETYEYSALPLSLTK